MKEIDINNLLQNCSYCISLKNNQYLHLANLFSYYNIMPPKMFEGIKVPGNGKLGCTLSHIAIIMMAKHLKLPYVLIFEDDAYPRKDILEQLNKYIQTIPDDCGILLLGHCGIHKDNSFDNNIFYKILDRVIGSHAYIVFEKCYNEFLYALDSSNHVDGAFNQRYFNNNTYILAVKEILFIQQAFDDCINYSNYKNNFLVERSEENLKLLDGDDKSKDFVFLAVSKPPVGFEIINI